jgi:hypothetical protein
MIDITDYKEMWPIYVILIISISTVLGCGCVICSMHKKLYPLYENRTPLLNSTTVRYHKPIPGQNEYV